MRIERVFIKLKRSFTLNEAYSGFHSFLVEQIKPDFWDSEKTQNHLRLIQKEKYEYLSSEKP